MRFIDSSSSSERTDIVPFASNLKRSSTIPLTIERLIQASLTVPSISTLLSSPSFSTPMIPLPLASNTWATMIPSTVVSFFQTDSRSSIIESPLSSVFEIMNKVPLPISQDSRVFPILCCHPWPSNSRIYFCEPFSFSHC